MLPGVTAEKFSNLLQNLPQCAMYKLKYTLLEMLLYQLTIQKWSYVGRVRIMTRTAYVTYLLQRLLQALCLTDPETKMVNIRMILTSLDPNGMKIDEAVGIKELEP